MFVVRVSETSVPCCVLILSVLAAVASSCSVGCPQRGATRYRGARGGEPTEKEQRGDQGGVRTHFVPPPLALQERLSDKAISDNAAYENRGCEAAVRPLRLPRVSCSNVLIYARDKRT